MAFQGWGDGQLVETVPTDIRTHVTSVPHNPPSLGTTKKGAESSRAITLRTGESEAGGGAWAGQPDLHCPPRQPRATKATEHWNGTGPNPNVLLHSLPQRLHLKKDVKYMTSSVQWLHTEMITWHILG